MSYELFEDAPAGEAWYIEAEGDERLRSLSQRGTHHGSVTTLAEARAWKRGRMAYFLRREEEQDRAARPFRIDA